LLSKKTIGKLARLKFLLYLCNKKRNKQLINITTMAKFNNRHYYKIDVSGQHGYSFMVSTANELSDEYDAIDIAEELGAFEDVRDPIYAEVDDLVSEYDIKHFIECKCCYDQLAVGDEVKWNDPAIEDFDADEQEMQRGRVFIITDIISDEMVAISDEWGEAEVLTSELEVVR
jgi:hypothetical protein